MSNKPFSPTPWEEHSTSRRFRTSMMREAIDSNRSRLPSMILLSLLMFVVGCTSIRQVKIDTPEEIADIALQRDILWLCGTQHVHRLSLADNSLESFLLPCGHLHLAKNGWVWTYWSYRLAAYDGVEWREFTDPVNGAPIVHSSSIRYLAEARDGTILVSSDQLSRYNPLTDEWEIVIAVSQELGPNPEPTPTPCFFCTVSGSIDYLGPVYEATDGALWLNEPGQGIARWHPGSKQIWGEADGLSSIFPTVFVQAHDGSMWVGTLDGVNRFSDEHWASWNFPGESHEDGEVLAILADRQGQIWVSFESGLMLWNGSTWNRVGDFTNGYQKGEARVLFEADSGAIWICCNNEQVVKYADGVLKNYPTHIAAFTETPDNGLLGGGVNGVFAYDAQADQWRPFPEE